MNGFFRKPMAVICLAGGLAVASGCDTYRNLVDPCYPERYEYMARQEVQNSTEPQISNGHVLDQTVWNQHFEPGTDKLTPGGLQHLAYLARRRPSPDCMIYLQTAQDIRYDPAAPQRFAEGRSKLDADRMTAVQNYLTAYSAGRHVNFAVFVHDPSDVGMSAVAAGTSIQKLYSGFQGNLPASAGAGASSTTGGGGASGGGGSSGGSGR